MKLLKQMFYEVCGDVWQKTNTTVLAIFIMGVVIGLGALVSDPEGWQFQAGVTPHPPDLIESLLTYLVKGACTICITIMCIVCLAVLYFWIMSVRDYYRRIKERALKKIDNGNQ